ncbi:MAG: NADH-quinone oxidoreductase subunit K [Candidatus Krumholzibacteriia bacterium]
MTFVLAVLAGVLFAGGVFCLLRRSIMKLVIGLMLLSQAANLLVFTAAGVTEGAAPLVAPGAETLAQPHPDPLPQALVLTAIVIGFGLTAFALALLATSCRTLGCDDIDAFRGTGSR